MWAPRLRTALDSTTAPTGGRASPRFERREKRGVGRRIGRCRPRLGLPRLGPLREDPLKEDPLREDPLRLGPLREHPLREDPLRA
tara:strand:+ start:125 stop:379 length:255 start_codon:yes stop_codon:yes gene_type:complete